MACTNDDEIDFPLLVEGYVGRGDLLAEGLLLDEEDLLSDGGIAPEEGDRWVDAVSGGDEIGAGWCSVQGADRGFFLRSILQGDGVDRGRGRISLECGERGVELFLGGIDGSVRKLIDPPKTR